MIMFGFVFVGIFLILLVYSEIRRYLKYLKGKKR
jgi:hypothetical protein